MIAGLVPDLIFDLVEVVRRRILQRLVGPVRLQMLEGELLPNWNQVPVVLIKLSEVKRGLFAASGLLERVTLQIREHRPMVFYQRQEPRLRSGLRHLVGELPVLPAHRGESGSGVVEEFV